MAVSLTHTTVAVGTDAGNGEIAKAQWNEPHTLTMATNKLLGRATAGDGAVEEIDLTAAGRALLDDATAADQRTTLGVGIGDSPTFTGLTLTGVGNFSAGTALLPSLIPSGDTNTGMWFPAADTIAFSTGGSERLRITSTGAPQVTFQSADVWSNGLQIRKRGTTGDANAAITTGTEIGYHSFFGFDGAAYRRGAFVLVTAAENFSSTNAGTNYAIFTAAIGGTATSERLRITASGNVGIGTSAPDALLSVNGIASFGDGAAATPSITNFGDLNTGMWFPAADTIAASTNGTERLRVDSNGNVVINTAAIATTATDGFLYVPSCAGTPTGTPTAFTGRVPIVVDTTNNKLYFYSGGAWRDAGP
jgi:hypothetical protein